MALQQHSSIRWSSFLLVNLLRAFFSLSGTETVRKVAVLRYVTIEAFFRLWVFWYICLSSCGYIGIPVCSGLKESSIEIYNCSSYQRTWRGLLTLTCSQACDFLSLMDFSRERILFKLNVPEHREYRKSYMEMGGMSEHVPWLVLINTASRPWY